MPMLPRVHPMRLRLAKEPFDDPDYLYELKHDGFRALAYIERGECKLVYRNLEHLRFNALEEALATLPVQNAIIDGEIVCIDAKGVGPSAVRVDTATVYSARREADLVMTSTANLRTRLRVGGNSTN